MTLFSLTVTFLILLDPLGNIPVFLAVLSNVPLERQKKVIVRECLIAFLILNLVLFLGKYVMHELQITTSALGIAGGIILFFIAIRMIFPPTSNSEKTQPTAEPFIVPLAMPMIAGPSIIALLLLWSTQHPEKLLDYFIALTAAVSIVTIILTFSAQLQIFLGKRVITALERLMGMILTVIAVQMLLNGLASYFHSV